jgi:hypothetical protein
MTKRRREVLYFVAFHQMHGAPWKGHTLTLGHVQHLKLWLHGVDVTAIVLWLSRKRLVRLWAVVEMPTPGGFTVRTSKRCLVVTDKGMEELLCPTM